MNRTILGFVLGVATVLATLLVVRLTEDPTPVSADISGEFVAIAGNHQSNNRDLLWLITKGPDGAEKLLVYDYNNRLQLVSARNISYDLWLDEHGTQSPTVTQIFNQTKPKHKENKPQGK